MNKKLFSRGIYLEGLRQLRIFGFIALSIYLVILICAPIFEYVEYLNFSGYAANDYYPLVVSFEELLGPLITLPLFVAPIMTLIVFSGFNKRRYSDFYHSLPFTRLCIFLSYTGAILTWVFGILILGGAVSTLMHCILPQIYVLSFIGWADVLLSLAVMILMVVAAVLLGCSFTGTLLANVTASGLILFLPRVIITMITETIATKLPFIVENHFLAILSPRYNILIYYLGNIVINFNSTSLQGNLKCDVYSLGLALVMGILAAILFVRRKSETASQSAPRRSIQAGIRIGLTLVLSLGATCILLTDGLETIAITFYIFAILIYFIYELLSTRKWKNLLRIIPSLSIVLLLNLAFVGLVLGTMHFSAAFRPAAEEITSVRFAETSDNHLYEYAQSYSYGNDAQGNYAERAAQNISIEDPEIISIVAETLQDNMEAFDEGKYQRLLERTYTYDDTRSPSYVEGVVAIQTGAITRYRRIIFPYDSMNSIVEQLASLPDYRDAYMALPEALSGTERVYWGGHASVSAGGTDWDWDAIFSSLREEIDEAGFEAWYKLLNMNTSIWTGDNWAGTFLTYTAEDENLSTVTIPISKALMPKTLDLLLEEHYNSSVEKEADEAIRLLKGEMDIDYEVGYSTIQITFGYVNDAGESVQKLVYPTDVLSSEYSMELLQREGIDEETITDMMHTLGEQLENVSGAPQADAYVSIYYDYLTRIEGEIITNRTGLVYFPLPENFNFQGWEKLAEVE